MDELPGIKRLLPSTNKLLAFDVAARTGSFSNAARELNITQSAVSKQVLALEELLGVELFHREAHSVRLTDAGATYLKDIRKALDLILSASTRMMTNPGGGLLHLAVLPTFGTRWLMPRLPGFLAQHPGITVHFVTKLAPFDFRTERLDAAIHFGSPSWPNVQSTYLMGEEIVPVSAPGFRESHRVESPADLVSKPLLHIASRPDAWRNWFASQGVEKDAAEGMEFEQFATAAQAAAAGMGAVLLPRFLIDGELERGELVELFDLPLRSEQGYYLVIPHDHIDDAPVAAFREWLLATARAEAS